MKNGVIVFVNFSLMVMPALTVTFSEYSIKVHPEQVRVKQGNNVSLWCQCRDDSQDRVPVLWQSPPNFRTRTSDCQTFGAFFQRIKYVMSCAESDIRWYNMTITDVRWVDRGKYRCIHTRDMGLVDVEVLVPVRELLLTYVSNSTSKPTPLLTYVSNITSSRILTLINDVDELMIICTTNCAYPTPAISWFENDQPFNGNAIGMNTESGCTGDRKGQKRALSSVRVTGKYMYADERKESEISCVAENLIGEPKIFRKIDIRYKDDQNDSPEKHENATIDDVTEERQRTLNEAAANANVQGAWSILLPLGIISIFSAQLPIMSNWLKDFIFWLIILPAEVILLTLPVSFAKTAYSWLKTPPDDQAENICEQYSFSPGPNPQIATSDNHDPCCKEMQEDRDKHILGKASALADMADETKGKEQTDEVLQTKFNKMWEEWLTLLAPKEKKEPHIQAEVGRAIRDKLFHHEGLVRYQLLQNNSLTKPKGGRSLHGTFVIQKDDISKINVLGQKIESQVYAGQYYNFCITPFDAKAVGKRVTDFVENYISKKNHEYKARWAVHVCRALY